MCRRTALNTSQLNADTLILILTPRLSPLNLAQHDDDV